MAISVRATKSGSAGSSRAKRYANGKALRGQVPRSAHAVWTPAKDRPDPVDLLLDADAHRVPSLVPIRYGRMSLSPFAFLRGAASVMAHDLSATPTTGIRTQLCGDAHLSNFGVFGTPERDQVFDVNDFDETLPGPWEWDVKRLATSLVVAGRQNGFSPGLNRKAARTAVRAYRERMGRFARERYLDTWYSHLDLENLGWGLKRGGRKLMSRAVKKARRRTGLHAFPKMVKVVNGRYRIRDDPPLIVHYTNPAHDEESRVFFDRYLATLPDERRMLLDRYHIVDVAQKVVGVGSVGTACSVLLLMADRDVEDPLFLQLKQAGSSALEPYQGASPYANHAQRVVVGQHLMQEASDIFLGWSSVRSEDFYVRQLRDMKFSSDVTTLGPKALLGQAALCGTALARAHARTGDPASISGYLGEKDVFDEAIAGFAVAYADQTERDYRTLMQAVQKGRVVARPDV
ncbi:MAG TPA: DUF2252 domain-containing protein [Thermoplasmata archaeon]|nr:DUF2252 domain-containing protein [Thermoplasmata archaeon]